MRIWIDPVKLAARGLSASDLAAALRANNVQSAPGQIKGQNTAINITAAPDLRGIDDFRNMVVKSTSGGQVRLGDVATVELGGQNYDSDAMAEGHRAVFIGVAPTPARHPPELVTAVHKPLPGDRNAVGAERTD